MFFFGNPHKTAWLVQSPTIPLNKQFLFIAQLKIPTCFQPKTLWETPPCRKSWLPMVMPRCNVKYIGNGYNAYLVMSYQQKLFGEKNGRKTSKQLPIEPTPTNTRANTREMDKQASHVHTQHHTFYILSHPKTSISNNSTSSHLRHPNQKNVGIQSNHLVKSMIRVFFSHPKRIL